jgi:RNA polymerase sigma factor (sigma-70 family)
VEASAIPASVGLARTRLAIGGPLLRIRSDEQLVSLFRAGNEDAFRVIHDRYRQRVFAYTRQMLSASSADAEDAVQEIFVRAYAGLRASDRELALRAWLYRIAHNRCIDELRRPQAVASDDIETLAHSSVADPAARVEQRDALRRLIGDIRRLPEQQRSALLMRELGGVTYAEISEALGVSVPAVKSLLVRARVSLAQASEARDTACAQIRNDLILSHDRGVRSSGLARRHLRDCPGCREFRSEVRGVSRRFAALTPTLGPAAALAKLLGIGGAGSGGAFAGSSGSATVATAATGAAGTGAVASVSALATGAGHVATLLAAAVVTAGGAIELQHIAPAPTHHPHHAVRAAARAAAAADSPSAGPSDLVAVTQPPADAEASSTAATAPAPSGSATPAPQSASPPATAAPHPRRSSSSSSSVRLPISETMDPDQIPYLTNPTAIAPPGSAASSSTATPTPMPTPSGGVPGTGTVPAPTSPGTAEPTTLAAGGPVPATTTTTGSAAGATGSSPATGGGGAATGDDVSGTAAGPDTSPGTAAPTPTPKPASGAVSATASTGSGTPAVASTSTRAITITPARAARTGRGHHGTVAVLTMTGH